MTGLPPCERSIPEHVKKNALVEIFNILVYHQKGVESELSNKLNHDDPIFAQLRDLLAAGAIPTAD